MSDTPLDDIFFTSNNDDKSNNNLDDYEPKYRVKNSQAILRKKIAMGNLIIKKMKTSGGADLDWIIERNGNFLILQSKVTKDDFLIINKAQMQLYEALYSELEKCIFLLFGHKDIDFKNPKDFVWLLDMRDWMKNKENVKTESESLSSPGKYVIELKFTQKITVDNLRDIIDAAWQNMK